MEFTLLFHFTDLVVPPRTIPVLAPVRILGVMVIIGCLLWHGHRRQWFKSVTGDFLRDQLFATLFLMACAFLATSGAVLLEGRPSMAQRDILAKLQRGEARQIAGVVWHRPATFDADNRVVQPAALAVGHSRFPYQQSLPGIAELLRPDGPLQNGRYVRVTHVKGEIVKLEVRR